MLFKLGIKKTHLLLILVVLVVWGVIISRIVDYLTSNEEEPVVKIIDTKLTVKQKSNPSNENNEWEYVEIERDPFAFGRLTTSEPVEGPVIEERIFKIPEPIVGIVYKINGFILNSNKKMILLEDVTNNKTLFLREGEEYENLQIKEITKSRVTIKENGKDKEVMIGQ